MNSELAKPVSRKDFGQINVTNLNKHFSLKFAKNLQVGVPTAQAGPVYVFRSEGDQNHQNGALEPTE